jgi:hypothetical protein
VHRARMGAQGSSKDFSEARWGPCKAPSLVFQRPFVVTKSVTQVLRRHVLKRPLQKSFYRVWKLLRRCYAGMHVYVHVDVHSYVHACVYDHVSVSVHVDAHVLVHAMRMWV